MEVPEEQRWSRDEACLLTMLSLSRGAMSAGALLLRSDRLVPVRSWELFAESMGRLVAADLVIWLERLFFVTEAGRAVSPSGEGPRYFKDLFAATEEALNDRVSRSEPLELGLTREEYEAALAHVAEVKDRRRTRRGYSGMKKWAEWDAPPLAIGDCIEFLTFIEGRDIVVKTENAADSVRFEGRLGLPLPQSPDPDGRRSVIFPVRTSDTDAAARRVLLRADRLTTASYLSFDGVDYFTLRMTFDDGSAVTVADANAPSI